MIDLSFTMVIQWVNFIVLLFLLRKLLFKPITRFLDERQKKISDSLREATEKREIAHQVLRDYRTKLSGIHNEALQIFERAKKEAHEEHLEIVKDAHKEASGVVERAKEDAMREMEKASLELRAHVADLIVSGASKVLGREVSKEDNSRLIDDFLKELSKEKGEEGE